MEGGRGFLPSSESEHSSGLRGPANTDCPGEGESVMSSPKAGSSATRGVLLGLPPRGMLKLDARLCSARRL